MQYVLTSVNTAAKYKLFNHRPSRIPKLAQTIIDGKDYSYERRLREIISRKKDNSE